MPSQNKYKKQPDKNFLLAAVLSFLTAPSLAQNVVPLAAAQAEEPLPTAVDFDDGRAESSSVYLRRARDTLARAGDFTAALNPAQQVLAEQTPSSDIERAADLQSLARIQAELGELDDAEINYLQAIDLIEASDGALSLHMVGAYRGLGRTYIKNAQYPEAITALEQAQHISQRNLGLFNVEQTEILDDITTAYLGVGNTIDARRLQLERLNNAVRRFGVDDPRVIPFRYRLADYYQRSRLPVSAREQYQQVLKSQETQLGREHPDLLSPLRELAKVDLMMTQGEDEAAYSRLVAILQRDTEIDPIERGLSLAVLGDWAIVEGDTATARSYYKQAWDSLSSRPDVDAAAFFSQPVMLDFIAPLSSVDRGTQSKPYAWGSIVFEFDLSADGRPFNVQTAETNAPPGALASRYNRRLREAHFRPRLVAGEPVALDDVQFTHYFRFYVNEER